MNQTKISINNNTKNILQWNFQIIFIIPFHNQNFCGLKAGLESVSN